MKRCTLKWKKQYDLCAQVPSLGQVFVMLPRDWLVLLWEQRASFVERLKHMKSPLLSSWSSVTVPTSQRVTITVSSAVGRTVCLMSSRRPWSQTSLPGLVKRSATPPTRVWCCPSCCSWCESHSTDHLYVIHFRKACGILQKPCSIDPFRCLEF